MRAETLKATISLESPMKILAATVACALAVTVCHACAPQEPEAVLSSAAVTEQVRAKVRLLSAGYPSATMSRIRFNDDKTIGCGVLSAPGRESIVFVSMGSGPNDPDRGLLMPSVLAPPDWEAPRARSDSAAYRRICAGSGLLD